MMCPEPILRLGAICAELGSFRHHGADASALKNSAPRSFTAFRTSESRSIALQLETRVSEQRIRDAGSNIQTRVRRTFDTGRKYGRQLYREKYFDDQLCSRNNGRKGRAGAGEKTRGSH